MKVDLLKKLIKEAVKEAIREELYSNSSVKNVEPQIKQEVRKGSIDEMLNMTRSNMGASDYKNIMNFDSSHAMNFPTSTTNNKSSVSIPTGPQPGLDITNLDFVKKAASVYNLSVEKDKQKLGGF